MSTLYLIRHAESEANNSRILASRLPFPLTTAGKADADLIAGELKEAVQINRIISSPLIRAKQTAESFSSVYNLTIEEDDRIIEQDLGIYKGLTYDQVKELDAYEADPLNRWDWIPEGGGESYSMISERIISFFSQLESRRIDENILIVTHAVSFRLIRAVLENTLPEYPKAFPNNGEIWKVEFSSVGNFHTIESLFLGNSKKFTHNP